MNTEPLAYWNGAFLSQSQVHVPLNDAGFVYGATVSDLVRTFRHQLFRLDAHLIRFRNSCDLARIPQPLTDDQLAFIAQELIRHNAKLIAPEQELILVMFATPGEIGFYAGKPGEPGENPPTLCMHTFPLVFSRYARLFREGASLAVVNRLSAPSAGVPPSVKHRSRLHWWIAGQDVRQSNPHSILLLTDHRGHVTETATANFVWVIDDKVLSPDPDQILGGVSLMVVADLCNELGIPFQQRDLEAHDLKRNTQRLQEAMLCSTPYCLAPVSSINGRPIPFPGPIFRQLLAAWSRKVGVDIAWQICGKSFE